ncbi:MAG: PTS sugar transporter subunit IIA [Desulfobacterales bacterium]|nr:PTS sugar transporter subunit IIA [Desulfobacterales bacterium]MDJ0874957.1 PTS sugar transporter subunit IIA [Desulfobacterales bacterium]MDJ0884560.1 PTS sugar transporter subunit IIA [Desulfobacterales bacterium]
MKILDALTPETIIADLKSRDKMGLLEEMATPVARIANIEVDEIVRVLHERERLGSTGIGGGIGIPHGKLKNLDNLLLGFGISRQGVDFESMDNRPTHIFFLLITPENSTGLHLKVLARISRILKNEPFKERLMEATSAEELYAILGEEDEDF